MSMTLRLTEEQTTRLRETAARERISMHAVVLTAIDEYTTRRTHRRDEIIARIMAEDVDALVALADL
jgi:predicted transcriptional regulator